MGEFWDRLIYGRNFDAETSQQQQKSEELQRRFRNAELSCIRESAGKPISGPVTFVPDSSGGVHIVSRKEYDSHTSGARDKMREAAKAYDKWKESLPPGRFPVASDPVMDYHTYVAHGGGYNPFKPPERT